MSIHKRIVALRRVGIAVLTLCLLVGLCPLATAVQISDDTIITEGMKYLNVKEGNCDSINRDDNGAVSIGMIQWHGSRALTLLQQIVAADPDTALSYLGEELYLEIITAAPADWNARALTVEEAAQVKLLLATQASIDIQVAQARADISNYLTHGRSLGFTTPAQLLYYIDMENQYGQGGAKTVFNRAAAVAGTTSFANLTQFHAAVLAEPSSYVQNYIQRRISAYDYIVNTLGWETPEEDPAAKFTDVEKGSWYYSYVSKAVSYGLFTGTSDTTFAPNGTMTRAMLVKVLYSYEKACTGTTPAISGSATAFVDVKDGWYKEAVLWAAEIHIVNGIDATHFDPEGALTKEMLATMLYRYAQQKGQDVSAQTDLSKYADAGKISGWAQTAVSWSVAKELMGDNPTLDSGSTASRSVAAKILVKYVENYGK